jgi:putative thioredoxin
MSESIFDVDREDFEEKVVAESFRRPVVVDFWASWCGPCRTLGPILEDVVRSTGDRAALARVDADRNPELSMQYQVRGIPAVKIFREGKVVKEFVGALPRSEVEAILKSVVPDENDGLLDQADLLAAGGDETAAAGLYERVLGNRPGDERAILGLARVRLAERDHPAAREWAERIQEGSPHYDGARAVLSQVVFAESCAASGGRAVAERRAAENPEDLDARFQFAACCAGEGDYASALKEWLSIVERKRGFRDGAAKEAMVSIFHLLGQNHEVVGDYPQRLYRALY